MSLRARMADALHRIGAFDAALRVRGRLSTPLMTTLTYHHISSPVPEYRFDPGVADAEPAQFRHQIEALARRCTIIDIDTLCKALDGGPLPKNPAMITFDDGYRSCREVAMPILRAIGVPATFFVATSFVRDRRLYWWERIAYTIATRKRDRATITYPTLRELDLAAPDALGDLLRLIKNTSGLDIERVLDDVTRTADIEWSAEIERRLADQLIMTWDDVRALAAGGMDVESHSRTHRVLQTLAPSDLDDELAGSRADLEAALGRPVRAIAYPVGRSIAGQAQIRRALFRAGYRVGFTNASGATLVWSGTDRFDIRRWAIDPGMSDAQFVGQAAMPAFGFKSAKHNLPTA
jgi:peptidoglycan/xylan/chitin deacetylase (PgdA/CDA1 family)